MAPLLLEKNVIFVYLDIALVVCNYGEFGIDWRCKDKLLQPTMHNSRVSSIIWLPYWRPKHLDQLGRKRTFSQYDSFVYPTRDHGHLPFLSGTVFLYCTHYLSYRAFPFFSCVSFDSKVLFYDPYKATWALTQQFFSALIQRSRSALLHFVLPIPPPGPSSNLLPFRLGDYCSHTTTDTTLLYSTLSKCRQMHLWL